MRKKFHSFNSPLVIDWEPVLALLLLIKQEKCESSRSSLAKQSRSCSFLFIVSFYITLCSLSHVLEVPCNYPLSKNCKSPIEVERVWGPVLVLDFQLRKWYALTGILLWSYRIVAKLHLPSMQIFRKH